MKELFLRYKQIILYLFFGACTTLINTLCHMLLFLRLGWSNAVSTLTAWFVAVLFAFFTNRRYVFESRSTLPGKRIKELLSFFQYRALTGVLDLGIMLAAVDWLHWNSTLWKLISNVIVTILNYVFSKYLVFKKPKE